MTRDSITAIFAALDAEAARLAQQRALIEGLDRLIRDHEGAFGIDVVVDLPHIDVFIAFGQVGQVAADRKAPGPDERIEQADPAPAFGGVAEAIKTFGASLKAFDVDQPKLKPTAPRQPAPQSETRAFVTGPFTGAENATILAMARAGKTAPEIAAALNRKPQGVGMQIPRILEAAKAAGRVAKRANIPAEPPQPPQDAPQAAESVSRAPEAPAKQVAPVAPVPALPQPSPREPELPPVGAMASAQARARHEAHERLERLYLTWRSDFWTPARDLQLVEALTNGDGLANAAAALGVGKDDAKARWKALIPGEVTLEAQAAMLAALRERCAAREAAE